MKMRAKFKWAVCALALMQLSSAAWAAKNSPLELLASSPLYRQPVVPPPADFVDRCVGAGVIFCDPMDSAPVVLMGRIASDEVPCRTLPQALESKCKYRSWRWVRQKHGSPIMDEKIRADGTGSLRLTFPSNSSAGSGGFYNSNFSPNLTETFGEGEPFFVQFRVRFSCDRIWMDCDPSSNLYKRERRQFARRGGGHTGFKIAIIEVGDVPGAEYPSNHCELTQIVLNHSQDHAWSGFHSCGWYAGFVKSFRYKQLGSRQIDRQPLISSYSTWPIKSIDDSDRSHQCLRLLPDPWRKSEWGDSDPNCFTIDSDVWYTVTQQVITFWQPERKGMPRSLYRLWIQKETGPTQLVIEHNFHDRGPDTIGKEYGKIILLPHSTKKDEKERHPDGYIWYDSVIVSKEMIPPAM